MVISLSVGVFASNCHILPCPEAPYALVFDPGDEAERIADTLKEHHLQPAVYLLTHGHMDHVSGLAALEQLLPAPIALHPLDARWAFTEVNAMPPYYDTPRAPRAITRELREGQEWTDHGLRYQVLETPGHSVGSVSFYFPDLGLLFPGDVLFAGSVGRTDIPGGSTPTLMQSLRKLIALPPETKVYPGHGPATTLAEERRSNPFLREHRRDRE
jgi:glyoxylase-like metal-dependent hydrolase (beta-lactamase superfamily II)